MKFNEQVTRIEPSPLRAFNDMAHKEGAELFLTLGEPDFHTPQQVKDACGDRSVCQLPRADAPAR